METHSSILAWRIPWTEEPGRLQSIGLHRVAHTSGYMSRNNKRERIRGNGSGKNGSERVKRSWGWSQPSFVIGVKMKKT